MKRTAAALLLVAVASPSAEAGGGCFSGGMPSAEQAVTTINIMGPCWSPGAAIVAPGATVTFRNASGAHHDLGGPGIPFQSLEHGSRRTVTFERPGLYPFACSLHPGMAGVLVVRAGVSPGSAAAAVSDADAAPDAKAAPVPASGSGGGGSALPWVAGAVVLGLAGTGAFVWRARGVPLPAR